MFQLRFILASLTRSKARSALTLLTIIAAFLTFGLLLSLERVFNVGIKTEGADRLVVTNKASVIQPLPLSYRDRLMNLENIEAVASFVQVGTFYQSPKQPISTVATEPRSYVRMIRDLNIRDAAQMEAWVADPTSMLIGRQLADKYGWKIGDLVPLYSSIYPKHDNSNVWTFRVAAIYDSKNPDSNTKFAAIHFAYFDQMRLYGKATVGAFMVRLRDAAHSQATSIDIEALFANSPAEVEARPREALAQEFMRQIGDFGLMITLALSAVFCTLSVVLASSMAQAVSDRTAELSVLKTIGFSDAYIFSSVFLEGFALVVAGALAGMAGAALAIPYAAEKIHLADGMVFMWTDVLAAAGAALVVATVATLVPALNAMRLNVISGLAKVY